MATKFSKVKCGAASELSAASGVDMFGATAVLAVPAKPPHLPERLEAYVLVAGDVGEHGQALTSAMRWIRCPPLDADGHGISAPLESVVAFRLAHVSSEPVELVYSIRKAGL